MRRDLIFSLEEFSAAFVKDSLGAEVLRQRASFPLGRLELKVVSGRK